MAKVIFNTFKEACEFSKHIAITTKSTSTVQREGDRWWVDDLNNVSSAYDNQGFDRHGFDRDGFDRNGCDKEGYDKEGYDKDGYGKDGFNKLGFDSEGYNRDGYNEKGFDRYGIDHNGFNSDGYKDKNNYQQAPDYIRNAGIFNTNAFASSRSRNGY